MRDNDTTPSLPIPNLLVMESWENPLLCPSVVHGTLLHGQDFPAMPRSTWETRGANPSVPPLVMAPPPPCGGEETTWGSWPGTNELAGFQEPTIMSSNTISVKQRHFRAHVCLKLKDQCFGIPCCRSAACPDHSSPSCPPGVKAFSNMPSPNLAPWSTSLLTRGQILAHLGSNSCFHSGLIRLHVNKDPNPLFLCVL